MKRFLQTFTPILALAACDPVLPNASSGSTAAQFQPGIDTCMLFAAGDGFNPAPLIAALYLPDENAPTSAVFRPAPVPDDGSTIDVTYDAEFSTCKITRAPATNASNLNAILRRALAQHGYEPSGRSHGAQLFSRNGETIRVIPAISGSDPSKEMSLTFLR